MADCSGCPFRWHDSDCEYCGAKNDEVIDHKSYSKSTCPIYKEYAESKGISASSSSTTGKKAHYTKRSVLALFLCLLFGPLGIHKFVLGRIGGGICCILSIASLLAYVYFEKAISTAIGGGFSALLSAVVLIFFLIMMISVVIDFFRLLFGRYEID